MDCLDKARRTIDTHEKSKTNLRWASIKIVEYIGLSKRKAEYQLEYLVD